MHAMFVICTGKAQKKAVVVENDKIVVKLMCKVVFTMDHRFGDASLVLKFLKIVKEYVENPETFNLDKYEDSKPYN